MSRSIPSYFILRKTGNISSGLIYELLGFNTDLRPILFKSIKYPYLPTEGSFYKSPKPLWKFQFNGIHFFKCFGLWVPPTPQEFPIPSVGGVWIFSGSTHRTICVYYIQTYYYWKIILNVYIYIGKVHHYMLEKSRVVHQEKVIH